MSGHPLEAMVRKLKGRARLTSGDVESLYALPYVLRTLEPLSYTVREGDPPRQCAALVSGYAFRQKVTGSGNRQIVGIHVTGDMLDLQNLYLNVSDHNVQTLTRADVAFIPRTALVELALSRPAINHAFFVDTLIEASVFREWVVNVGRRDARSRLAHLLCEFAVRLKAIELDAARDYELPMTQEQLADAVGLTPVHVNRTLKGLERDGLIRRDRRSVRIADWANMRATADFSERYLHLDQNTADAWA